MPTIGPEARHYRAKAAVAARDGHTDAYAEAVQQLQVARLAEHIERIAAEAPPLTPEQVQRLTALLNPPA